MTRHSERFQGRRRSTPVQHRPTGDDLVQAVGRTVPDVIGPDLRVLFCGINPGLWSGAVGHHFAHPGNRFWKALHASGFTGTALSPADERSLLDLGLGVTNLVAPATRSAAEVTPDQLRRGARDLATKVRRWHPGAVAVLGITAYRTAFARPHATVGRQPDDIEGTPLWVLPNPSGIQAHYPVERLVTELRQLLDATSDVL